MEVLIFISWLSGPVAPPSDFNKSSLGHVPSLIKFDGFPSYSGHIPHSTCLSVLDLTLCPHHVPSCVAVSRKMEEFVLCTCCSLSAWDCPFTLTSPFSPLFSLWLDSQCKHVPGGDHLLSEPSLRQPSLPKPPPCFHHFLTFLVNYLPLLPSMQTLGKHTGF